MSEHRGFETTDALPFGFLQLDAHDRIIIWNRWLEERTGHFRSAAIGLRVEQLIPNVPKYTRALGEVRATGQPLLRSQLIHQYLLPISLAKGHLSGFEFMQQECHLIPAEIPEGSIAVTIRDVTSIVVGRNRTLSLQKEWKEAKNEAIRGTRLKTDFLNMMSHEIRTPLNSIHMFCLLLLGEEPEKISEDQLSQIKGIQSATQDLTQQVNDLLDIGKIESGKVSVQNDEFTLAKLFTDLRLMLQPQANNPEVKLSFEDSSGTTAIRTDENKLSHILRNLITNALKYTLKGSVHVSAHRESEAIVWKVSDTGIGIAELSLERVFDEFYQVENTHQRKVVGTGLGLVISRKLAAILGGTLSAESQLGIGSTFSLSIPLERLGIK